MVGYRAAKVTVSCCYEWYLLYSSMLIYLLFTQRHRRGTHADGGLATSRDGCLDWLAI